MDLYNNVVDRLENIKRPTRKAAMALSCLKSLQTSKAKAMLANLVGCGKGVCDEEGHNRVSIGLAVKALKNYNSFCRQMVFLSRTLRNIRLSRFNEA